VFVWANGVYCNARLEDERSCLLVTAKAASHGENCCSGFVLRGLRKTLQWRSATERWAPGDHPHFSSSRT